LFVFLVCVNGDCKEEQEEQEEVEVQEEEEEEEEAKIFIKCSIFFGIIFLFSSSSVLVFVVIDVSSLTIYKFLRRNGEKGLRGPYFFVVVVSLVFKITI